MSSLSDQLLEAYRATRYEVDAGDHRLVLRIDEPSEALARLHAEHGVNCSAFVTTWNPGARIRPEELNMRAQRELLELVEFDQLVWLPGIAVDPENEWPDEPSWLVLGMDASRALELARRFGQNAVVWTGEDMIPRLLLTGDL